MLMHPNLPQAVSLRAPVLVFPVDDFDSCNSVVRIPQRPDDAPSSSSAPGPVASISPPFHECILVRPGSTLADVFQVFQHSGFVGQDRDLVRTERLLLPDSTVCQSASAKGVAMTGKARALVKKGDVLSGFAILKVFTNARKEWQRQTNAR
jgi:hypothetical protein